VQSPGRSALSNTSKNLNIKEGETAGGLDGLSSGTQYRNLPQKNLNINLQLGLDKLKEAKMRRFVVERVPAGAAYAPGPPTASLRGKGANSRVASPGETRPTRPVVIGMNYLDMKRMQAAQAAEEENHASKLTNKGAGTDKGGQTGDPDRPNTLLSN